MSADIKEERFDYSGKKKNPGTLIVMIGISGSGKSTYVKALVARGRGTLVRLNRDDMRKMIYGEVPWDQHHDKKVRKWEMDMAKDALLSGLTVFIDDTNCIRRTRAEWEKLAQTTYSKLTITSMTVPVEECVIRDKARSEVCPACLRPKGVMVGEGIIRKQLKDLTEFHQEVPKAKMITRATMERDLLNTGGWVDRLPNAPIVIFDTDGTTATHIRPDGTSIRGPFDESKVLLDEVVEIVAEWVRAVYPFYNVYIVSGRKDSSGDDTAEWYDGHGIPFDHLLMRRHGDNRSDTIVKKEILDEIIAVIGRERIAFVVDDRPKVVKMWRGEDPNVPHPYGRLIVYPVRGGTVHSTGCPNADNPEFKERQCPCGALADF